MNDDEFLSKRILGYFALHLATNKVHKQFTITRRCRKLAFFFFLIQKKSVKIKSNTSFKTSYDMH